MLKKLPAILVFIFSLLFFVPVVSASTLYLSPGSANIPQGSVVSVRVGLNTGGESINGISAYLSYPSDKLEVAWITYGGSFSIAAEGGYGGGGIRISRGSISGVVGNVNVATIGFRGKNQGSAAVFFIGGSGAARTSDSSDSLNLGGSTGGTFTVVAGVPGGQAGASAASLTEKDQKAPDISNINVSLVSTTAATISWTTDEKADSEIEYGLQAGKYFLFLRDQTLTANHTIEIQGPALSPGALFHFRVKSKDAAGNEGVSGNKTFQLKGYNVTVKILDANNMPIPNKEVFLYSEPSKSRTSLNGEASFINVTSGKHLIVVKINNNLDKAGEINVQDSPLSQAFTLGVNTKLKGADYSFWGLPAIGLIGIAILAIIIIVLFKRRRKSQKNNPPQQSAEL